MTTMTFDNRITIRIDDAMNAALNRVAARRRKKPAEVGREALTEYLERTGDLRPVNYDDVPLCASMRPDRHEDDGN